jgi:hypothetical protein
MKTETCDLNTPVARTKRKSNGKFSVGSALSGACDNLVTAIYGNVVAIALMGPPIELLVKAVVMVTYNVFKGLRQGIGAPLNLNHLVGCRTGYD